VTLTVAEIAAFLGAPFEGDGAMAIHGVAPADGAGLGEIAFALKPEIAAASGAGCLLASFELHGRTVIRAADPRASFARVIALLNPVVRPEPGVHPTAVVEGELAESVFVGPHAVIGKGARIGPDCVVGAACFVGDGVEIGPGGWLHPRVTISRGVRIGARAILHSGCVLGADGFGFAFTDGKWEKFPQVGAVEIGDDVEIGANACVDRAALGVTRIGNGVKLDNMVHVGHNCRIGDHVVIAAQTGLSGGVTVGDYAVIGGQVGVGDKARIESKAVVGSGAGILTSKIVRAGEPVWGTPARPLREYLETLANMSRVGELRRRVKKLEERS
jgi:UDP-3-O-[3-hydroxymyristoyl] glucosamine N-acyltransferase